jgi:hypothetical protein
LPDVALHVLGGVGQQTDLRGWQVLPANRSRIGKRVRRRCAQLG